MSKIKYSALVNTISGKLSGSVFSRCRGVNYLKTHRPTKHQPHSEGQQLTRGILNNLSGIWYSLPQVTKDLWESRAAQMHKPMTGLNAFNSLNLSLAKYLGSSYQITNPPAAPGTPPFPEIVSAVDNEDGTFDISWTRPELTTIYIITKYWIMPGLDDRTTHRWAHGAVTQSDALTANISTEAPSGSIVKFKLRSMDLFGRLSPWTHIFPGEVSEVCNFTWENLGQLGSTTYIRTICYLENGIAIAGTALACGIWKSIDYGLTWSGPSSCFDKTAILCSAYCGNGIVILGTSPGANIFRSIDYGATWTDLGQFLAETSVQSVCYLENGIALAGLGYHCIIARSIDYGATWVTLPQNFDSSYVHSICYCGNGIALYGTGSNAHIWRSIDYGATWQDRGRQYGQTLIRCMEYLEDGIVLAGTATGGLILRSIDYGLTWSNLGQQFGQTTIWSLTYCGNGIAFAGTDPNGKILKSTDYGETWEDLGQQFSQIGINSIEFCSDCIALAGTFAGGLILRTSD